MNTIAQTVANSGIDPKLIRAVAAQVGVDHLEDLARHGASGGFPGITYTRDTVAFFKKHRKSITALVESMAADFGEDPLSFVAGFQCLAGERGRARILRPAGRLGGAWLGLGRQTLQLVNP